MTNHKKYFLLHLADDQCQFLLLSYDNITQYKDHKNNTIVFYNIQNFLISASNLSKTLWGDKKDDIIRKEIREELGLKDDSPLKCRKMRNHFEHINERIDKHFSENENIAFADRFICPRSALRFSGDRKSIYRHFDLEEKTIYFWDEPCNFELIKNEVLSILSSIKSSKDKILKTR